MALFERNWMNTAQLVLKSFGQRGLLSFTAHKIVNQDQDLTRMHIFEYESAKVQHAFLFGRNLGCIVRNIAMKLTAYRGVQSARWTRN